MSVPSEQPREQPSVNPKDPLQYAPRRVSERSEPRLAAVVGDIQAAERSSRPESKTRPLPPSASLSSKLDSSVYESLRRQIDPEIVPEPADFKRERSQRALIGVIIGIAAAIVVSAAVAVVFVTMFPRDRGGSFSFATVSSQQQQSETGSKSALSQFRALMAGNESGQNFTHEESERLLQQFMQWRQKADSPEKP